MKRDHQRSSLPASLHQITVKLVALLPVPFCVVTAGPVAAPAGTLTMIFVWDYTMKVACTPRKVAGSIISIADHVDATAISTPSATALVVEVAHVPPIPPEA